jgi:hypothetical protein
MGGVHRSAAVVANHPTNELALCATCHSFTEDAERWQDCVSTGLRIPHFVTDPADVPALIHTVNGYGWWRLTQDGGYLWADLPNDYRIIY